MSTARTDRPSRTRRGRAGSPFRLRAALVIMTMVLTVFGARLVQLQGLDQQAYAARAEASGLVKVTLPAARGRIIDRDGSPLATSVSGSMIVADPKLTRPHAGRIAQTLADRLGLDYFDVLGKLSKEHSRFQYIARRIPSVKATGVVNALDARGLPGLYTRDDPLRSYPAGDVGANLVGFINDGGQPAAGLEQVFNDRLRGRDGEDTYEVGGGNRIPLGDNSERSPVNGRTLRLTIDRDAQFTAQRMLRQAVHQVGAKWGAAVAMDSRTGELLTLADYPSYDANHGSTAPQGSWVSRAVSQLYEPGSVQKVLTMSSLVNQHLVDARTQLSVPASLRVLDRTIHDYFTHGGLHLTLAGVIAKSSNIGTVIASRQIRDATLRHYLGLFGEGRFTGLGLPGETGGLLPQAADWNPLTKAQISFGQGLGVNAVQMASAVNTIANGGQYVSPSLVEGRARTSTGHVVGTATTHRHRVVSAATAREVAQMMETVTTEGKGTAPMAKVPGYRVAGKTGTAQEIGGSCRCYAQGHLAVSFAGFAPADKPRFTVYVVLNDPAGGATGGGTAGPVVRGLLSYLLQKYGVPPTQSKPADLPIEW